MLKPRSAPGIGFLLGWFAFAGLLANARSGEPFEIRLVDRENQWPVPLVELKTTHQVRFVSDNQGRVAFDLPELMNVDTWLFVQGHGYSVPADGFGFAGVRVRPKPGESVTIELDRQLPAKRLGRITGGGLFAESQKLGKEMDWIEQRILGCDSVQNAVHQGRLFWLWGDTILPGYPLGRFHMIGATTITRPLETLEPPIRLRYDYFLDESDVPRNVAEMHGSGPTWLSGLVSLPSEDGKKHLVASYSKIEPPLTEYECGLCEWIDADSKFVLRRVHWKRSQGSTDSPPLPRGHVVFSDDANGVRWAWFGDPFPTLRCRATFEEWSEPKSWEVLDAQATVPGKDGKSSVKPHRGAIAWSDYRERWVAVFTQLGGDSSYLGELWYAEADSPTGPWSNAIKVVTHQQYSFYNPQLHPEFTEPGSPVLLFEATYTQSFSGAKEATPRNDYNQVLYRLDLDQLP